MTDQKANPTIDINYVKSASYREVPCDGALGGITPQKKLWVGFYSERLPLPRLVRHELIPTERQNEFSLDPNGTPLESRGGLIRNVEFGIYLSKEAAKQLHEWLGDNLKDWGDDTE